MTNGGVMLSTASDLKAIPQMPSIGWSAKKSAIVVA